MSTNRSLILNLSKHYFKDKQVVNTTDKRLIAIMLDNFNTKPSIPSNVKRALAVADFVKQKGHVMAIVECPNFMVLTLHNIFLSEGIFLMFPYEDEKGNLTILDINGNPITRGEK